MNFKIYANDQSYQSIYINPEAQNWQEVIVFHEPIFDDEMPGVVALKSLRLENCLGFVLGAPRNKIRYFREKVKELDSKESLGKCKPQKILETLLALVNEIGGSVIYIQNKKLNGPEENISGTQGPKKRKKAKRKRSERSKQREETENFFDPLTKRKLITIGPQYFDPSLPTEKKEVENTLSFLDPVKQRIYSPDIKTYPANINKNNLSLWDDSFDKTVYSFLDNESRWNFISKRYETVCSNLEIPPYEVKKTAWSEVLADIKNSFDKAKDILFGINELLNTPSRKLRSRLVDIVVGSDCYHIITDFKFNLQETSEALSAISKEYDFKYAIVGSVKNVVKQINDRTSLTITESDNHITANISYKLPYEEAKFLCPIENLYNLKLGLICNYRHFKI